MFDNIGGKIKGFTKFVSGLGIIASVVLGLAIGATGGFLIGVVVAVIGSLVSWISGFMMYGFGELVDAAMQMKRMYSYTEGASIIKAEVNKPWVCKHCGQENSIVSAQCKGCGQYRS